MSPIDLWIFYVKDIIVRTRVIAALWYWLKIKDTQYHQRFRVKWVKENDAFMGFFHVCVKSMIKRNYILTLKVGEYWVQWMTKNRQEVVNYFSNQFKEPLRNRSQLDEVMFSFSFSIEESSCLTYPFMLFELDKAVALYDDNKIPRLDGFNFSFLKGFWHFLRVI